MYLEGSFIIQKEPVKAAKVLFYGNKADREVLLLDENNQILSAYKQIGTKQYMAKSDVASKLTTRVNKALTKIKKSGGEPVSFNDYPAVEFFSETRNATITVVSDRQKVFKVDIDMDVRLTIAMTPDGEETRFIAPPNIPYVELSKSMTTETGQEIVVRTVEEVKLTKTDISWLDRVTGIVVQDDALAEKYFNKLEETNEAIAYDTETTGIKINCFGKINSKYARALEKYNAENVNKLNADKLCGIIFATKTDTAVYFPCFSRKFTVLYQEDTPTRRMVIDRIRADYKIGRYRDRKGDMADHIRSGAELTPDIILMERVRLILETKYIVAHNASFEYKVGFMYDIITNVRDDTMLLHQILYRYGPDPRHRRSGLKALSQLELGIDQWDLKDFFPAYKEDDDSRLRTESQVGKKKKKKKVHIDFSYMDLEGTKIYAPADGYCTKALWVKYKKDLKENWPQMERIYLIEVAACIGMAYCEFYGHKLDERQVETVKQDFIEQTAILESKIRAEAKLSQSGESDIRTSLELARLSAKDAEKLPANLRELREEALTVGTKQLAEDLKEIMSMDVFNIGSSKQLCALFYDTMGMPETSKGRSVAKDAIKALLDHKNEDGSFKYPIVKYFQEWKAADTLLSKFFDNLGDYMWPGGYIFSSYGQITAATGRMSCIAEGELVTLVGEKKPIEQVQIGDLVYCYDENKNLRIRPVLQTLDRGMRDCVEIRWKSRGKHTEGSLICTPDHKVYLTDGRSVRADSLKPNDVLAHLRVGVAGEERPRLYGLNGLCIREQDFIKREWFNCEDTSSYDLHHKDENKKNNRLYNLVLMTKSEHHSLHAQKLAAQGRIKTDHLAKYQHLCVKHGSEHSNYISLTKEELEQMVHEAKGVLTAIPMDFETFKQKCLEQGVDYISIGKEYRTFWQDVDDETFTDAFFKCEGVPYRIAKMLNIGRTNVANKIKRLDLCYNYKVLSVTPVGKRHVYDLSVEEHHNFIASEIKVSNCKQPNAQQYPKAITKIVIPRDNCVMMDADFSQIEYRVLVALAKEPALMQKFFDPDVDYHTMMASLMFGVPYDAVTPGMRGDAKRFNFGIPYGMGIGSIAMGLFGENTPKTREMAKAKRKLYFKEQPLVEQFFERVKEAAVVYGYTETAFKRRRYYTFTSSNAEKANAAKAAAMRQAGNAVIQGCLRGDSKILTKEYGYISIGALADLPVTVWDGTKFVSAWVRPSGPKKEYEVKLTDNNTIYCSANHGFLVAGSKGKFRWRSAKDLPKQQYFTTTDEVEDWCSNDLMLPKVEDSKAHNARNHSMADIKDDYERGLLAGHLAGDGSVTGDSIQCTVAEHEKDAVLPVLEAILAQFGPYSSDEKKSGLGTQMMYYRGFKSKRLYTELKEVDIKNRIPLFVWNNKETLRGYLRARLDSDGTVNDDNVVLTLGRKHERESLAKDIQQALYLFGIHSRLHYCEDRINVTIRKKHVAHYRDRIGFINPAKQAKLEKFEVIENFKTFGRDVVKLKSVKATGREVEMFDVVDSESSQFMANGLVTHNTAADIFKIALARSMKFIIKNDLFGKVFLTNMVHDELLWEIDVAQTNPLAITTGIGEQMSFALEGYPPLFIGAGVSNCWAKAKSKDCEIHPVLLGDLTKEVKDQAIDLHTPTMTVTEWLAFFDERVMSFRQNKIIEYLTNTENFGQNVHPEVGNLIRLLYQKHISEEGINPKDPGADAERTLRCVEYVSDKFGLGLDRNNYRATGLQVAADDKEDAEYDDGEDGPTDGSDTTDSDFEVLEDDKISGVRIVDLIREFEYVVAPSLKICGIDDSILTAKKREDVYGFLLNNKQCSAEDEGALELVLHIGAGVLKHTNVYVNNIGTGAEIEQLLE